MIRHMVLLGALGAGAFGGRQRGDGFQLRLVLERGKLTLANRKSRIMRRRVATHNVRANAPRHTISGTCGFGALSFPVTSMLFSVILMR